MTVDVLSDNKHIYPKEVIKKAIDEFNSKYSEENPCLCDNEQLTHTNLNKVSHSLSCLKMDKDDNVVANITILDTPEGKIIQDMINDTYRSKGIATIDRDNLTVCDYTFISVQIKGK